VGHVAAAFVLFPLTVSPQMCAGNPSLGTALSGNVGMVAAFPDGGTTYGANATFGAIGFGRVDFEYTAIDGSDLSIKRILGTAGYEAVPEGTRLGICPTIGLGYGFGLELEGVTQTTLFAIPALAAGLEAGMTPSISVVPFARLALVFRRDRYDRDAIDAISSSDGLLELGVRLVVNARVALGPVVLVPIAAEGDDAIFGVSTSLAFGGAR
jgi:hypothetical protein